MGEHRALGEEAERVEVGDRPEPVLGHARVDLARGLAEVDVDGCVVTGRDGGLRLMAFIDTASDGSFGGCLGDPVPLHLTDRGTLQPSVTDATAVTATA